MISLSRLSPGPGLKIRNYQGSGAYVNTARISRTALLNGSSNFSNYGVSDTDRDFIINCRLSQEEKKLLKEIYKNAETVRLTFWEGSFLALVYRCEIQRDGEAEITFYFKEKLA